jgi:hypothetical protein
MTKLVFKFEETLIAHTYSQVLSNRPGKAWQDAGQIF